VANQHPVLPVGGEPRPVAGHRRIEVELTTLDKQQQAGGDQPLRAREDRLDRVAAPRPSVGRIGGARPHVDDEDTVEIRGEARSHLAALADDADWARACGSFDLGVAKSTVSHHCNVLRTAGLIEQRDVGSRRLNRLRRGEYDARFPGLLALVLDERER